MEEQKKPNIPWWQPGLVLFTRLSAWIVGPIILAVILGKYLDRIFHTEPWLFLLTVISSFTLSIVQIVRIGLKEMESQNSKDNRQNTTKK